MMLAAQLWLGYLAAHPAWIIALACACLPFLFVVAFYGFTDEKHVAHYGRYTPQEVADYVAVSAQVEAHDPGPLTIPLGIHLPALPGAAVNITSPGAGMVAGEIPARPLQLEGHETPAPVSSPPAGHPPLPQAGRDVPGPASHPSPGKDGVLPSAVLAAGPGTRNGPPWETKCHDPGHQHDPALWPVEDDHVIPIGSQ